MIRAVIMALILAVTLYAVARVDWHAQDRSDDRCAYPCDLT